MKAVNKIQVASSRETDDNKGLTEWKDGKCISLDEGTKISYYIGHETVIRMEDEKEVEVTLAFPIRVDKPAKRDALINAAEMAAYNLRTPMDVASFTASLARKSRENADDEEVREHDTFIAWVKDELTKIGK